MNEDKRTEIEKRYDEFFAGPGDSRGIGKANIWDDKEKRTAIDRAASRNRFAIIAETKGAVHYKRKP